MFFYLTTNKHGLGNAWKMKVLGMELSGPVLAYWYDKKAVLIQYNARDGNEITYLYKRIIAECRKYQVLLNVVL